MLTLKYKVKIITKFAPGPEKGNIVFSPLAGGPNESNSILTFVPKNQADLDVFNVGDLVDIAITPSI